MRAITEQVIDYLQDQKPVLVDFLSQMVLAESPSHQPETQRPVQEQLARAFEDLDYEVQHLPGRSSGGQLYAAPPRRNRQPFSQMMLGHCDTVWPVGTLDTMPLVQANSTLKGPGVFDMKAGLTLAVFALRTLKALNLKPEVSPIVLVNSDEEIGSDDSRPHIERLAQVVDRALILEPSMGHEGLIKTSRKGTGQFDIIVKGKAAHAGLDPGAGASAILEMSYVVQQLFALNNPKTGVSVNVGTLDGGIRPNVIAPESRISVDVRVPTPEDATYIEQQIRSLEPTTPGVRLEIEGGLERLPLTRTPRNKTLWQRYQALGEEVGVSLQEGLAGGASDGNFTSQYTATLDGLGAVGDGAHAIHEFIYVEKTLERCALLTLLLLEPALNHRAV